jgi:hypothetical protein
VDAELEALQNSTTRVRDLVLKRADRMSSLGGSLSLAAELIEDRIDATATNGVRLGTRSALAAALLHFLKLGSELEFLGSWCNVDLTEDQVDALSTQACQASNSLKSFVPPSIAHGTPDGMVEE